MKITRKNDKKHSKKFTKFLREKLSLSKKNYNRVVDFINDWADYHQEECAKEYEENMLVEYNRGLRDGRELGYDNGFAEAEQDYKTKVEDLEKQLAVSLDNFKYLARFQGLRNDLDEVTLQSINEFVNSKKCVDWKESQMIKELRS